MATDTPYGRYEQHLRDLVALPPLLASELADAEAELARHETRVADATSSEVARLRRLERRLQGSYDEAMLRAGRAGPRPAPDASQDGSDSSALKAAVERQRAAIQAMDQALHAASTGGDHGQETASAALARRRARLDAAGEPRIRSAPDPPPSSGRKHHLIRAAAALAVVLVTAVFLLIR